MKNKKYLRTVGSIVFAVLVLLLAGCGGGVEFIYRVGGTASEVEVAYTNADGEIEEATVSLPWEKTFSVGSEFSFDIQVIGESASGTVTCEALVGDDSLGEGSGSSSVECHGNFSKKGSSMTSSFSSVADPLAREHVERGSDYLDQGELGEAAAEFEDAVGLAPNLAEAHLKLGLAYYRQGRFEESIAEYERTIGLDPDNVDAHRNLGSAYGRQGRLEEALVAYEKAIELDPDFGEAYGDLAGIYVNLEKFSEAVAAGEKAIELSPDYDKAHNNLGLAYYSQDRLDEAIAEYEEALKLSPDYAGAYYNLGLAYYKQGRLDETVAAWREALKLDPDDAEVRYNLGIIYADQGRLNDAIAEWKEIIRVSPDHASAHYNLGLAYSQQGRAGEAIAAFETYLQLQPDAPDRAAVEEEIAKLKGEAAGVEHANAAGGYSLLYPEGWYVVEKGPETSLAPSKEGYEASSLRSPLVTLVSWPLAQATESFGLAEGAAPDEFLQVMATRLEAEMGEMESVEIVGYPAAVGGTSGTLQGTPYEGDLIIILVGERIFLAEGLAPPDQWADFRPAFVDMIKSLSFFEPEG